jgi:hypothetical protein
MDDTNIGAPHLGHRRCILGGNVAGSKLCACDMAAPFTDTGGSATGLSVVDACEESRGRR